MASNAMRFYLAERARARGRQLATREAELEAAIDRRVMRRLETDRAYLHAENAEEQAQREEQITRQVEREFGITDGGE